MTVPEVMNSSPAVDAAIDPLQPVRNQDVQMIAAQALGHLRQLMLQRHTGWTVRDLRSLNSEINNRGRLAKSGRPRY